MAESIRGTRTEKNLLAAFAGESQARNRYTYFASVARKEGYEQISRIFLDTADNEKEHAKVFFQYLEGGEVEITATYPAGRILDTRQNLVAAAEGERLEWGTLYPNFAEVAREEGFPEIARSFEHIARAERFHEGRYRKLATRLERGEIFLRDKTVRWHCLNCGYIAEGTEPPAMCPACRHPRGFYEVLPDLD